MTAPARPTKQELDALIARLDRSHLRVLLRENPRTDGYACGDINLKDVCEMYDAIAALRAERDALRENIAECDGQLSRVLHELAGSASLCWEPKPSGVFDSTLACEFVAARIAELRAILRRHAPDCLAAPKEKKG